MSLDEALIRLGRVWTRGATTDQVGAVPQVEPAPTLPVPPRDIDPTGIPQWDDEILSELLLGESLDSAQARLIAVGWSVRTRDLDVPVTQTADLRADRVNLAHGDGIVTGVSVG